MNRLLDCLFVLLVKRSDSCEYIGKRRALVWQIFLMNRLLDCLFVLLVKRSDSCEYIGKRCALVWQIFLMNRLLDCLFVLLVKRSDSCEYIGKRRALVWQIDESTHTKYALSYRHYSSPISPLQNTFISSNMAYINCVEQTVRL